MGHAQISPARLFFCRRNTCGNREFLFPPKEGDPSKPSKRRQNFVCILFVKNVAIKTETRYIFWSLNKKKAFSGASKTQYLYSTSTYTSWRNCCAKSRFLIAPPLPLCYTSCDGIRRRRLVRSQGRQASGFVWKLQNSPTKNLRTMQTKQS